MGNGSLQVFFSFLALAFFGVCTRLLEKNVILRKDLTNCLFLKMKPNKKIKSFAIARWDANS